MLVRASVPVWEDGFPPLFVSTVKGHSISDNNSGSMLVANLH